MSSPSIANGILEKTLYFSLGTGNDKASPKYKVRFFLFEYLFLRFWYSSKSISIPIMCPACLVSSSRIIPEPGPISKTRSFLPIEEERTSDLTSVRLKRKFCDRFRFLYIAEPPVHESNHVRRL